MELHKNSSNGKLKQMAKIVDKQNKSDKKIKYGDDFEKSLAFQTLVI